MEINKDGKLIVPPSPRVRIIDCHNITKSDVLAMYCSTGHNDIVFLSLAKMMGIVEDRDEEIKLLQFVKRAHRFEE